MNLSQKGDYADSRTISSEGETYFFKGGHMNGLMLCKLRKHLKSASFLVSSANLFTIAVEAITASGSLMLLSLIIFIADEMISSSKLITLAFERNSTAAE